MAAEDGYEGTSLFYSALIDNVGPQKKERDTVSEEEWRNAYKLAHEKGNP